MSDEKKPPITGDGTFERPYRLDIGLLRETILNVPQDCGAERPARQEEKLHIEDTKLLDRLVEKCGLTERYDVITNASLDSCGLIVCRGGIINKDLFAYDAVQEVCIAIETENEEVKRGDIFIVRFGGYEEKDVVYSRSGDGDVWRYLEDIEDLTDDNCGADGGPDREDFYSGTGESRNDESYERYLNNG